MRLIAVHGAYNPSQPSGENLAVEQQTEALRRMGHDVEVLVRQTPEVASARFLASSSWRTVTGSDGGFTSEQIGHFDPDLVIVHNLQPNFGTNWIRHCRVPVVLMAHNFRFTCLNGLLLRSGKECFECVDASFAPGVRHACYQGARMRSLPWALGDSFGTSLRSNLHRFSAIIAQSTSVLKILHRIGFEQTSFLVPGFVEEHHGSWIHAQSPARFVAVGRDSVEKGLEELVSIWPRRFPLDVIGSDGGNLPAASGNDGIEFMGMQSRCSVVSQLGNYAALVFPGISLEGAIPLVVREAIEAGVPVVARAGSPVADFIRNVGCGTTYAPKSPSSLLEALEFVVGAGDPLREKTRITYTNHLSEVVWRQAMSAVLGSISLSQ